MNQERIILELMSRIQVLEEEVGRLKRQVGNNVNAEEADTVNKSEQKRMKIRKNEVEILYRYAKSVYEDEIDKEVAVEEISGEYGLNKNSIRDYIYAFNCMLNGEKYVRTLNSIGTRYYYEHILEDYGADKLISALEATRLHIEYYESIGKTTMKTLRDIHKEFMEKAGNNKC